MRTIGSTPAEVDAWERRELDRALAGDPALAHTRRLLAAHGPLGRPPHPEHSQAESECRARGREEAAIAETREVIALED